MATATSIPPTPLIASRTSPTNIGLQLLATASAADLGFLTRGEMVERLERAFDVMDRMPRIRGHFYNWYDLSDLGVLDPPYVSTVDSPDISSRSRRRASNWRSRRSTTDASGPPST